MRRLAIVLIAIIALAVIAVLALRQALVGGPLRAAAESRLSAALGQPVTIGHLEIALLPRLALRGTEVRVGAAGREAPRLSIAAVRIVPRLSTIFSRIVLIEEVHLDGFVISVLHDRNGRWQAPVLSPAAGAGTTTLSLGAIRVTRGAVRVFDELPDGARERGRIDDLDAGVAIGTGGLRLSPLSGRIGTSAITGEATADDRSFNLTFQAPAINNADVEPMLALLGTAPPPFLHLDAAASASGTVRIDRAASRLTGAGVIAARTVTLSPLKIAELDAPFRIDGPRLTFAPATFAGYGGGHRGTIVVHTDGAPRWSADSRIDRIDVGPFLDALAGRDTRIDGTGRVDARVSGPLGASLARDMMGTAHVIVSDGVIHDFPLIAAVNSALRLTGGNLRDTAFQRLSATIAIGSARATTTDLLIEAGEMRITTAGTIGFDRSLNLRGDAVVSAARTAEAVASVHELARLTRDGRIEVPLTISGTVDNPLFRVDVSAALRKGIEDELMRRLRRIIR